MSCPVLVTQYNKLREDFAKKSITMDFECKNVIFSNEKKLNEADIFSYFWSDLCKNKAIFSKKQFGGNSVIM